MLRDEEHRGGIVLLHNGQPLPGSPGMVHDVCLLNGFFGQKRGGYGLNKKGTQPTMVLQWSRV